MNASLPAHAELAVAAHASRFAARARALGAALAALLRVYAGCLCSGSVAAGALLFAATALTPLACALGLLALGSALASAYALGLVSQADDPRVYTYNALFIGLAASATFGDPGVAVGFAAFGAAASTLLTASLRSFTQRVGLPSLSLPFLIVYLGALGCGRALGLRWAIHVPADPPPWAAMLPEQVRIFLEALGALVFNARLEAGALVLAALLATSVHALALTLLAFAFVWLAGPGLQLLPHELFLPAALNAMFTVIALAFGWYGTSARAYLLCALAALLCVALTPALFGPFVRLELTPLSLPFNLSIYAVLLIGQQQRKSTAPAAPAQQLSTEPRPDRRLLGG